MIFSFHFLNWKKNDYEIRRAESIKLLVVLLDEHLTWKLHTKYIKNKIAKGIDLFFKVKDFWKDTFYVILFMNQ